MYKNPMKETYITIIVDKLKLHLFVVFMIGLSVFCKIIHIKLIQKENKKKKEKKELTIASEKPSTNHRVMSPFWILSSVVSDNLK